MLNWFLHKVCDLIENLIHKKVLGMGFESHYSEGSHGRSHYYLKPGDPALPTIVIVHGITATASQWYPILPPLTKLKNTLIVPDLIGHGRSSEMNRSMTILELKDGFNDFLAKITPKKDVILIGNSLGGTLSLFFTVQFPERVKSLFLISPGIGFPTGEILERFKSHLDLHTVDDAKKFLAKVFLRKLPLQPIAARMCLQAFKRKSVSELIESFSFSDQEKIKQDFVPPTNHTLLIWGQQDWFLPRENIEEAKKFLSTQTIFEAPEGIGHCPQVDVPRWTSKRILSYLDSL